MEVIAFIPVCFIKVVPSPLFYTGSLILVFELFLIYKL